MVCILQAAVAKTLVLVVVSAGGVDVDETRAHAVLWAPYGGEEAGTGLADVLFGSTSPSARLPLTVYTQAWADTMNCPNYTEAPGANRQYRTDCNTSILHLDLEAGVGRTHRYITDAATYVKHAFGFGLSYTSFRYSGLQITKATTAASAGAMDTALTVAVTVTNTGDVVGDEIVQVYVSGAHAAGLPQVTHNLAGFTKVSVAKGGSVQVSLSLDMGQLATAQADGSRIVVPGKYTVWVGGHQPADPEGIKGTSGVALSAEVEL